MQRFPGRRASIALALRFHCGGVRADELDRGQNRLPDGQSRLPAPGADPRAIEQDKWAIPDPAAFASGVCKLRMQPQMFANPADGVVDFAIFVRAEIEDVYFAVRPINRKKNGVNAILHVQVRFSLTPVAQNVEMFGMLGKLPVKIEHVPVRVAFSQDRNEAENVALQSEAFTVGLNQALRGQFGSAVERSLYGKRTGLRRGKDCGLPVDGSGRRKHDAFAALLAHGFEHVPGCDRVLIQIFAWMFGAEANVSIRGKMNYQFHALHCRRQAFQIEQVALEECELRMDQGTVQEPLLSGREVIEPNHAVPRKEKAVRHIAADKTSRTRN